MSTGGIFGLIANDGKADRMLMATELLNQRIRDIMWNKALSMYKWWLFAQKLGREGRDVLQEIGRFVYLTR